LVETSAQHLEVLGPQFADVLKIPREQILGVGEFQFNTQSFIVELAPEVDLGQLKLDYAGLVCLLPSIGIRVRKLTLDFDRTWHDHHFPNEAGRVIRRHLEDS
jgi:hypothetical protein